MMEFVLLFPVWQPNSLLSVKRYRTSSFPSEFDGSAADPIVIVQSPPEIVPFYLSTTPKPIMVMPFFPTTIDYLKPVEDELATAVFQSLQSGVEALHKRGFAHSDLKPSNVLMSTDGFLCICDLGSLARIGSKTTTTIAYTPLELLPPKNENAVTASIKRDFSMLAMIVYGMTGGCPEPGNGVAQPSIQHVMKHLNSHLPSHIMLSLSAKLK